MRIGAFAAVQAAFETALAYDADDEGPADRLMDEFVGMADAMDTMAPDLTAQGFRMGLIRLSWGASQPEVRVKSTSDTPIRLRSETTSILVKQLLVRFDPDDVERAGANAEEYLPGVSSWRTSSRRSTTPTTAFRCPLWTWRGSRFGPCSAPGRCRNGGGSTPSSSSTRAGSDGHRIQP
jgi:hypothetical protein